MEYRLNKIDMEIRQTVNEATKEGKVHSTKDSARIDKNKKEKQNQDNRKNFKKQLLKFSSKQKMTVDVFKVKNIDIEASKENLDLLQGRFLDTKR